MDMLRLHCHKHVSLSDISVVSYDGHPDPAPFFNALLTLTDSDSWAQVCNGNVDPALLKRLIINFENWEFQAPPEIVGTVAGVGTQRDITPSQFSAILNAGGVTDLLHIEALKKNIETRFSGKDGSRAAQYWHLDYDVWNPSRYNLLTVSFSDDPQGGTHYLDIPQFKVAALDKVIDSRSPHARTMQRELLESVQSIIEDLTRSEDSGVWLDHYVRHTVPNMIYRNLTQSYFHKSPPTSLERVFFVIGVPIEPGVGAT